MVVLWRPPHLPSPSLLPKIRSTPDSFVRDATFDVFRRWGYLQSSLDPLGQYLAPEPFPVALPEGPEAEQAARQARRFYCGSIGAEFMHIPLGGETWLDSAKVGVRSCAERGARSSARNAFLSDLIRADLFEQVIQQRYLGTKRFSLEGLTILIPFLDQLYTTAADNGVTRSLFAMSHRGRLNVMVNTVGRGSHEVFAKFEDVDPRSTLGGGDVKYHMGATGSIQTAHGQSVRLHLVSNPKPPRSRRPGGHGPRNAHTRNA